MYLRVFRMRIAATKLTLKQQNLFCPAAPNLVQVHSCKSQTWHQNHTATLLPLQIFVAAKTRQSFFFYCKVDSAAEKVPPILVAAK